MIVHYSLPPGTTRRMAGLVVAASLGLTTVLASERWNFTTIQVPDSVQTSVASINDRGEIVGTFTAADSSTHGFRLSSRTFESIDVPGATQTFANGINDAGHIVGYYAGADSRLVGFLISHDNVATVEFPGSQSTAANDLNNRDEIVGDYQSADGTVHGFRLGHGVFTSIDGPGAIQTQALGIGATGDIVGTILTGMDMFTDICRRRTFIDRLRCCGDVSIKINAIMIAGIYLILEQPTDSCSAGAFTTIDVRARIGPSPRINARETGTYIDDAARPTATWRTESGDRQDDRWD